MATCAIASRSSTPGMIGRPGKWPGKNGSLMVTFFKPRPRCPGSISSIRSTRRNGKRCGRRVSISSMSIARSPKLVRGRQVQRVARLHRDDGGIQPGADERQITEKIQRLVPRQLVGEAQGRACAVIAEDQRVLNRAAAAEPG